MSEIFRDTFQTGLTVLIVVVFIIGGLLLFCAFKFCNIWMRSRFSGAPVGIMELIALRLRNVPAMRAGIEVSLGDLAAHSLTGGNVAKVVEALIAARKAGIRLDFDRACAIDLATKGTGRNIIEVVGARSIPGDRLPGARRIRPRSIMPLGQSVPGRSAGGCVG